MNPICHALTQPLGLQSSSLASLFPHQWDGEENGQKVKCGLTQRQFNKTTKEIIMTTTIAIMNIQNKLYTIQFFLLPDN